MARGLLLLTFVTLAVVGTAVVPIPAEGDGFVPRLALASLELDAVPTASNTVSSGAEPIIRVTRDGSTILVGDVSGLYRSTDGGANWARAPDPFIGGLFADGWAIAEDDAGRIYVADTNGPIVGVASSANNGASWDIQSKIVAVGSIVDRPWLAARGDGEVSLVVNSERGEECYRSTDGGLTWLSLSHVNNGDPNAGSLAYDSLGRLWYSNGAALYRWSNPCMSAPLPIDHPDGGAQIFVQVELDAQDRPYFAQPSGNNGQMLLYGYGAGGTFKSIPVSAPSLRSNSFGAIAVDKATGEIAVGWYGSTTPGDPSNTNFDGSWDVFVARVNGFWTASPTVSVTQVTSTPNHVGDFCMGGVGCDLTGGGDRDLLDYFGVTYAPDHSVHVAYGHDGAGSNGEVRYARLG